MSNMLHSLRRAASAALLVACVMSGAAAQAQTAASAPMTDTPMVTAVPLDDWRILNNPAYDYIDLTLAHTLGYSDSERASIAKIARLTGLPFVFVLHQVHQGRTFAWLAADYGLNLGDVLDASDEQARIDEYIRLYEMLLSSHSLTTEALSTAVTIPGPTLVELEAAFNKISASFPALPPTDIETTPIGSPDQPLGPPVTLPVVSPPAPQPEAPAPVVETVHTKTVIMHTVSHYRHHRHHRAHRRHRKPAYRTHRGS